MKIREIITEVIDTTESFNLVRDAIYNGMANGLRWLIKSSNNIPEKIIDDYDEKGFDSNLRIFIKNKTDYRKQMKDAIIVELNKALKLKYPKLNYVTIKDFGNSTSEAQYDSATDFIEINENHFNPEQVADIILDRLIDQSIENGSITFTELLREFSRAIEEIENDKQDSTVFDRLRYSNNKKDTEPLKDKISKLSDNVTHELVHLEQAKKQKSGDFDYRSYLGTRKFKNLDIRRFYHSDEDYKKYYDSLSDEEKLELHYSPRQQEKIKKEIDKGKLPSLATMPLSKDETNQWYKFYFASPQEITAFANPIARKISRNYIDSLEGYSSTEFVDTMNSPDYRKDLRDDIVSQVNQLLGYNPKKEKTPQTSIEKKVWKRYASQILALVNAQFARHVEKLKQKEQRLYS